jgi:stringent starvation protein B
VTTKPPPKRDVMLTLLEQAESVFVNFDPRRDGVVVPAHLKRQPRVVLQYGLNMRIPIPDLDVGEEGIGATLSFDRLPTWTFVPWSAVFAIISQDQRGMLWEADLPREIEAEHKKATSPGEGKKSAQPPSSSPSERLSQKGAGKKSGGGKRPALRAVDGGGESKPSDGKPQELRFAPEPVSEPAKEQPVPEAREAIKESPRPARASDEIVELPEPEPKKKREIPPYLRVVK